MLVPFVYQPPIASKPSASITAGERSRLVPRQSEAAAVASATVIAPALPPVVPSDASVTVRDSLGDLSLQDLSSIHLASVAHAASWQLANALQESCFASAETEAVKQLHALATCVEAAYQASYAIKTKQRAEQGRQLLRAALTSQVMSELCCVAVHGKLW